MKCRMFADRTRVPPLWASTYFRSIAISPDALPAPLRAPHHGDQSWAIEWNFSAESVRPEPNRRYPVSSENRGIAWSQFRHVVTGECPGEPRGSYFQGLLLN